MLPSFSSHDRVLVLAPHPDDETLTIGGLLQKTLAARAAVRILFITDGDNNPWPQRAIERRWRITATDRARWGERRRKEARTALACLGAPAEDSYFWGYPDQGLTELLLANDESLPRRLAAEIAVWRPTLVVSPHPADRHPDHSALALFLSRAVARLGGAAPDFVEIRYVVHASPASISPDVFSLPLLPHEQETKRQAILGHASQLVLSRRRFLAYATEAERLFLSQQATRRDDYHPIRQAEIRDAAIHLAIASRSSFSAFGPRTLYLAVEDRHGEAVTLAVALPQRSAKSDVYDVVSGAVMAQASFVGNSSERTVTIPCSGLPVSPARLYVKVAHRYGFRDEAGWRKIPLPQQGVQLAPPQTDVALPEQPDQEVCCIIPCYNVASFCGTVVREALLYAGRVIAVNDGSTDATAQVLHEVAAEHPERVLVLSFEQNRGKGVALLAAFRHALAALPCKILVTLDGDRQHRPVDIPRLVHVCCTEQAALVIGERSQLAVMPWRSRLGNRLTRALLRWRYPEGPLDTQSGLRALTRSFVEEVLQFIPGQRYETELQILLLALEQRQRISSLPIPTTYLNRNRSSHFRPLADSLRVWRTLLRWSRPASPLPSMQSQGSANAQEYRKNIFTS